jgi:hypothetical protein
MFGNQDLRTVQRYQEQLRTDAAQHRLAARINRKGAHQAKARRVFGLRLSLA